jgi:probable HAF family extracellular repeat protein
MQKLWSSDTLYRDYLPAAIGASGKIIGSVYYRGPLFVWDSADAAPRFLGDEPVSGIFGPNADGDFLVNSSGSEFGSASRAVLWRRDETRVDLGSLNRTVGEKSTWATAWNDAEQIVGNSIVGYGLDVHPFIWENGVMRDLGGLGSGNGGYPTAINAHGVVVGISAVDSLSRAFIWKDGVMRELDAFPGQETRAMAINDQGRVLGVAGYPSKASQYDYYGPGDTVFVWDNGQATIVTTTRIMRLWLTPNGTVIGNTDVDHEPHAFVWEAGVLTDFGPWTSVSDVNSHGDMVGRRGDMPMLWRKKGS